MKNNITPAFEEALNFSFILSRVDNLKSFIQILELLLFA